jgi:hypothetical protein
VVCQPYAWAYRFHERMPNQRRIGTMDMARCR